MYWKISIGEIDNIFSYISIANILKIINSCFYGLNNNEVFEQLKIFRNNKISGHMLIRYFFNFLFIFFFGFGLCLYKYIIHKKKNSSKALIAIPKNRKLIHNNPEKAMKTKKVVLISLFLYLLWFIEELCLEIFIISFKDIDCWMLEFIFLAILYRKIDNNKQIYRHQWLAIIIIVLSFILKIISIITTIRDDHNKRYELRLPILYTTNYLYLFGFFAYLLLIFLRAYVNTTLNWLMEMKFVPIKKILLWNGIIGSFFTFICIIIFSSIPCKVTTIEKYYNINNTDYYKYICTIDVNSTEPNSTVQIYLEKFSNYIGGEWDLTVYVEEIITVVIGSITFLLFRFYSLYIIKKGPIHFSISIPIIFFFQKLLTASWTMFEKKDIFVIYDGVKITKFILDVIGDIFAISAFLIYLEVIILNFNKFDHDIKINIDKRTILDEESAQANNLVDDTIVSES